MAITENNYTGNGVLDTFSFTFPYIEETDIKITLDGVITTAYSLLNATTIQFTSPPALNVGIRIYRDTNLDNLRSTFFAGSSIRAQDLNDNFIQNNYASQEAKAESSQAPTALTNSVNAVNTANQAASDAATALIAASNAVAYVPVSNVASIPGSPSNGDYIEVLDATGIESFTPLAGLPVGFVGDSGLSVRLNYTSAGSTWNWVDYIANDADTRYLKDLTGTVEATNLATDSVTTAKIADLNVTTAKLADTAVTTAKITDLNVTTGKLADNAVTTAKITDLNVTTAKLANDAVTAAKLADTTVSAGSYTNAGITVDAQGRLTAASNGNAPLFENYALLSHTEASGTDGGSTTTGSWETRPINTVDISASWASLSSNQFTLDAGTYLIKWFSSTYDSGFHQARLQNISDGSTVKAGIMAKSPAGDNDYGISSGVAKVTIASSKIFEIQSRVSIGKAAEGFGLAQSWGDEVYATVEIYKQF